VILINGVTALDDSTSIPTSLPTVQEPTRTLQELKIYLPLIYWLLGYASSFATRQMASILQEVSTATLA